MKINPIPTPPMALQVQRARAEAPSVDSFIAEAAERMPDANPTQLRLGALLLWEKSLTPEAVLPSSAGVLTGYMSALSASLGATPGPLTVPIAQVIKGLQPQALLGPVSGGALAMAGRLDSRQIFDVTRAIEGQDMKLHGVPCAGLWNEQESKRLEGALAKLEAAVPHLFPKLKGIVVETWLGATDPVNHKGKISGFVDYNSPGYMRLGREALHGEDLEHTLFHEFGHISDTREGGDTQYNSELNPAFTRPPTRDNCVSPYARTAPSEDLAETFAFCLQNRETILQHSDLYFHGLSELSDKLTSVFQEHLQETVPPLSHALPSGPFGFQGAHGIEGGEGHRLHVLKGLAVDEGKPEEALRALNSDVSPPTVAQLADKLEQIANRSALMGRLKRTDNPAVRDILSEQVRQLPDPKPLVKELNGLFVAGGSSLETQMHAELETRGRTDAMGIYRMLAQG